ncbi:ADP-ribose pyrophosphatase [Caldalkalibacillus uzonensis]|uniref:ADP-ribose pyrophosphatase n=1 Tax=Caldalkalibacillus uzonensis TaxID=353224 RepID=A0ABU0CTC2_9BACI|nr:NUDIX hydrolase [Caldalkalibacillus uzonensis]MDQ0339151.1 ADP-ribose pyrophosphatase [Caldalkalibacillus uzonensis]
MKPFYEKTIHTKPIFQGRMISLQVDEVELPNGQTSTREVVKHPGAVAVMPFTTDGRMVVVRQFRKPLEKEIYEIPAGKLEKGEDPASCALRELEEETGFAAESLQLVTSFYTSPGFADELLYIFEATGLTQGKVHPDEDEFVEAQLISLEEGLELMAAEQIHDAKTVFALMYWQNKRLKAQLGK